MPFGWSSAIADFNLDGMPDVAIADRVLDRAGSHTYRIEFSVSGQLPHSVAFESDQGALRIRVADVDHDDDLDVLVTSYLSGETVGVWLNDGQGRFTSTDVRQFPASVRPIHALDTTDPAVTWAVLGVSRLGGGNAVAAVLPLRSSTTRVARVIARANGLRLAVSSSPGSPRAPPVALPL